MRQAPRSLRRGGKPNAKLNQPKEPNPGCTHGCARKASRKEEEEEKKRREGGREREREEASGAENDATQNKKVADHIDVFHATEATHGSFHGSHLSIHRVAAFFRAAAAIVFSAIRLAIYLGAQLG